MTDFLTLFAENYNNIVSIILMMLGFYIVIVSTNLIKKLIGIAIFQTSVLLIYISSAYVKDARFPILKEGVEQYVNPLPHVLMLTAIVVGIATLAVGLALVVRIRESYGTIDEGDILELEKHVTEGSLEQDAIKENILNTQGPKKRKLAAITYKEDSNSSSPPQKKRTIRKKTSLKKDESKK